MGFGPKPGISNLSELSIDVSKDWQTKNITNFGASAFDVHAKLASIITKLSELTIDANKNWQTKNITNFGANAYDVHARLASIITKLSELTIDADKDWQTKNITNFGASAFDVHAKLASIITKLSELTIDADKNWLGYGISNIKELAASMAYGDFNYRGASVMEKLTAGAAGQFLRTLGPCQDPEWAWIPGLLLQETFFFLTVPELTVSVAVASSPGGGVTATPSLTVPAPSISGVFEAGSPGAVGGALADDGGAQTDETTEANSAAANDMTLLPATPAVNDAYYFGLSNPWDWLSLEIGTAGAGTWTIVWEYYNGATWETLPGVSDTSNSFRNGATQSIAFHRPSDWATSTILLLELYWIRARVSAYTSITTQPLGTQAWIGRWA